MYKKTILLVPIVAAVLIGSIIFFEQTAEPAVAQAPPWPVFEFEQKFLCGVIEEPLVKTKMTTEPPLGQGEYRTAINVINPELGEPYPNGVLRDFTWQAVLDDTPGGISPLITYQFNIPPADATEIDCIDIRFWLTSPTFTPPAFIKGFVQIRQTIQLPVPPPEEFPRPIVVSTAYTYEVVKNKIIFEVIRDPSGFVPSQDLKTPLEIVVLGNSTTVTNANTRVRDFLKAVDWNGLVDTQVDALTINIVDVELGVGSSLLIHTK